MNLDTGRLMSMGVAETGRQLISESEFNGAKLATVVGATAASDIFISPWINAWMSDMGQQGYDTGMIWQMLAETLGIGSGLYALDKFGLAKAKNTEPEDETPGKAGYMNNLQLAGTDVIISMLIDGLFTGGYGGEKKSPLMGGIRPPMGAPRPPQQQGGPQGVSQGEDPRTPVGQMQPYDQPRDPMSGRPNIGRPLQGPRPIGGQNPQRPPHETNYAPNRSPHVTEGQGPVPLPGEKVTPPSGYTKGSRRRTGYR